MCTYIHKVRISWPIPNLLSILWKSDKSTFFWELESNPRIQEALSRGNWKVTCPAVRVPRPSLRRFLPPINFPSSFRVIVNDRRHHYLGSKKKKRDLGVRIRIRFSLFLHSAFPPTQFSIEEELGSGSGSAGN
jgi:hypothetical protein